MVIDADMSSVAMGTENMVKNMMKTLKGTKDIRVEWYYQDAGGVFQLIK